jgi:hypothetical protein
MFFPAGIAAFLLAPVDPGFRVNYEIEFVSLTPDSDAATYHRVIQRMETDRNGHRQRIVLKDNATATIMSFSKKAMTIENVDADGSKRSYTMPMPKKLGSKAEDFLNFMGVSKDQVGDLTSKSYVQTKETKTIDGVLCVKTVSTVEMNGVTYETVNWNPADKRFDGWLLPPFETYSYSVDGSTRKLIKADTLISFKLGTTKPSVPR